LLHFQIQSVGMASLHGPMVVHHARQEQAEANALEWSVLKGEIEIVSYPVSAENSVNGEAKGVLMGGNLTMISHLAGSIPADSFADSILFLEEVGEYHYRIDRMLEQMKQARLFEKVKGIVLGQFTSCEPDGFPLSVTEMLLEKTKGKVPLFSGLVSGHGVPTMPLVLGAETEIRAAKNGFELVQLLKPDLIS